MSKNNIVLVVVVVLVIVGVAFWGNKMKGDNGYSVVYLQTGEVYVGKLATFPDLQLTEGYKLPRMLKMKQRRLFSFSL